MWPLGCCTGRLPSRIREAGINGLLPAARVPSIYSVSPLLVLDRSLPKQREGYCNLRSQDSANLRSANWQFDSWSAGRWSWPRLPVTSSSASSQALLLFNVAEAFTAIGSGYLTHRGKLR